MAFNIANFQQALVGEGARPTLFEARLFFPGLDEFNFTFKCKAAQLPGKTLGVIEVPYFGRRIKVAGDQTFAEWTVTVIMDETFNARNAFERWMSGINEHVANIRSNVSYMADGEINQYDKVGNIIKTYKFKGAWPSDISPVDTSWESNDALEEFTATIQFQWWEADNVTDKA